MHVSKKSYIDPQELPPVERAMLLRISRYLRPYLPALFRAVIVTTLFALLSMVPPILVKHAIDKGILELRPGLLLLLCLGMLVVPLLERLLQFIQRYLFTIVAEDVARDFRLQLFHHLQSLPIAFFTQAKPGEVLSRILGDIQGVRDTIATTVMEAIENILVLVFAAALALYLDWKLALMFLALLPALVVPTRRVGQLRREVKNRTQGHMAELTGLFSETLSFSGTLLARLFGAESFEAKRLQRLSGSLRAVAIEQMTAGRKLQLVRALLQAVGPALVFAFGGLMVIRENLEVGTVVAFAALFKNLFNPGSEIAAVHVKLVTSYAHFDRVFAVLDLEPSVRDADDAVELASIGGSIEFRAVSFSYVPGEPTLTDVNLKIHPGCTLALVGPSGAGKTTLASLIPRLHDPCSGAVLIDGRDIREVSLQSLRAHIGIVTQETYLFNGTIMDNLRYGCNGATEEDVRAALEVAQIDDMISALPESYETMVGNGGQRLSGGERRRVAIARALLKNPRILILDEATSDVDTLHEELIQNALAKLVAGRTCLVIAHRLTTAARADEIVVLDQGRICEQGTHTELLARGGLYKRMWECSVASL